MAAMAMTTTTKTLLWPTAYCGLLPLRPPALWLQEASRDGSAALPARSPLRNEDKKARPRCTYAANNRWPENCGRGLSSTLLVTSSIADFADLAARRS